MESKNTQVAGIQGISGVRALPIHLAAKSARLHMVISKRTNTDRVFSWLQYCKRDTIIQKLFDSVSAAYEREAAYAGYNAGSLAQDIEWFNASNY